MGYWTYTYACIRTKRTTCESMRYDGKKPVILALPDSTFLEEPSYFGYGIIAGHDVLELVVDWNMRTQEAVDVISKHIIEDKKELEKLIAEGRNSNDRRVQYLRNEIPRYRDMRKYLEGSGPLPDYIEKREVGIALATYEWEQIMLKYPIKFVKNKRYKYDEIKGFSSTIQ